MMLVVVIVAEHINIVAIVIKLNSIITMTVVSVIIIVVIVAFDVFCVIFNSYIKRRLDILLAFACRRRCYYCCICRFH